MQNILDKCHPQPPFAITSSIQAHLAGTFENRKFDTVMTPKGGLGTTSPSDLCPVSSAEAQSAEINFPRFSSTNTSELYISQYLIHF